MSDYLAYLRLSSCLARFELVSYIHKWALSVKKCAKLIQGAFEGAPCHRVTDRPIFQIVASTLYQFLLISVLI